MSKLMGEMSDKPNCTTGYACGYTCIERSDACHSSLSADGHTSAKGLSKLIVANDQHEPTIAEAFVNKQGLESRRSRLVLKHGAELVDTTETNIGQLLNSAKLFRRADDRHTDAILESGRFKSMFETGHSAGFASADKRRALESAIFGAKAMANIADSERPIYATIADNIEHQLKFGDAYGKVIYQYRDSVKPKATMTGDDSLSGFYATDFARANLGAMYNPLDYDGNTVNQLNAERMQGLKSAKTIAEAMAATGANYWEGQLHGGSPLTDVEAVHFTGAPPTPKQIASFHQLNIDVYDRTGYSSKHYPAKSPVSASVAASRKAPAKLSASQQRALDKRNKK